MEFSNFEHYEEEYGLSKEQYVFLQEITDRIQLSSNDFTTSGKIEVSEYELATYDCGFFPLDGRADGDDINLDIIEALEETVRDRYNFVNTVSGAPGLRDDPALAYRMLENNVIEIRSETYFDKYPETEFQIDGILRDRRKNDS